MVRYFLFFMFVPLGFPAWAGPKSYSSVKLPGLWVSLPPNAANIFSAVLAEGAYGEIEEKSHISIQRVPNDKKIAKLKEQIRNYRSKKEDQKFEDWELVSVSSLNQCDHLILASSTGRMEQSWCFGKKQSVVLVELGSDRIPAPARSAFIGLMREQSGSP